jgi:hypothetical protein
MNAVARLAKIATAGGARCRLEKVSEPGAFFLDAASAPR